MTRLAAPRLTLDGLWVALAVLLPALVSLLVALPAVDLAYQVRAGDEILATGTIPRVDTWTFTVWGTAWVDQQWLAQVLLAIGQAVGGWELLAVTRAALVATTTGLLVATARVAGVGARTAAILALAAFALMAPALALRPQLFGIALFAGLVLLVAGRERWPGAYGFAPLLVLAWANVHGSFVLGPVLLGYAWLDDVAARRPGRRRSLWVLLIGTLATLANPFLFNAWVYAVGIGANSAIAGRVTEWQRTSPLAFPGVLFYPAVVITAALMVRARAAISWPTWLLGAGMAVIGAWAVRGVAWWAVVMVLLLAMALAPRREPGVEAPVPRARRASPLNTVVVGLLVVVLLAALPWWRPADPLTGRAGLLTYAPSGLAAALPAQARVGARVLVPQTWGSWFEWAAPDQSYFIDSRFELYPDQVWHDYDALAAGGADAAEVLDSWAVDAVVLPAGVAAPPGDWSAAYSDDDGTLYVRQ